MEGLVEVGSRPAVTPLPNLPAWILGIVNLRSEIISVIDLAAFLDLPAARTQSGERFAVIRYRDVRAGIPIDRIYGTVNKSRNMQTMPLHPEIKKENAVYFAAGGFVEDEQLYSILDVKHLFSSRRFPQFPAGNLVLCGSLVFSHGVWTSTGRFLLQQPCTFGERRDDAVVERGFGRIFFSRGAGLHSRDETRSDTSERNWR
jgi:chemotaxis signal transduction protein